MRSWLRGPMTTATAGPNAVSKYQSSAREIANDPRRLPYSDDGGKALVHGAGWVRARAWQDTLFLRASCEKENGNTLSNLNHPNT